MEIIKTKSHGIIYIFFSEHQTAAEAMQLRKDMAAASKSSISKNEAAVKAALANVLFLANKMVICDCLLCANQCFYV